MVEETEYPKKTSDLPEITDKLYHIILYLEHFAMSGIQIHNLVVMGIDCIGDCKPNYHMIMTTPNTTTKHVKTHQKGI